MGSNWIRGETARLTAQQKFAKTEKREKEALKEKDKAFAAAVSKTVRLRSLRLAKEASENAAAQEKATEKKPANLP